MIKMDLGSGGGSKIFQMNDEDIKLITNLLKQESQHHIYQIENWSDYNHFQERYDHIQELIKELNKK